MKRIDKPAAQPPKRGRRGFFHAIALAVICLVGAAVYSNTFDAPFVFDDDHTLLKNTHVRVDSLDLSSLYDAGFKGPSQSRPLTGISFGLNYYWSRYDVVGYHAVNLAIHLINAVLVYLLALAVFRRLANPQDAGRRFGPIPAPELMAVFAALIFVAHPIQTQAVTYVSQRYASMAALFYLGSVLFYIRARSCGGWGGAAGAERGGGREADPKGSGRAAAGGARGGFFLLSIFCAALALMCKQNAATLPGAILLAEYLLFDRTWRGWKKKLLWGVPLLAVLSAVGLYLAGFFPGDVSIGELLEDVSEELKETSKVSRWDYLCTQFNVIAKYFGLLVVPVGQSLDHRYAFKSGFWDGNTPYAFLFLLAVAGAGLWARKKHPALTFGIFWVFIALSVESSVFPIRDAMFEHRLYLPMVGFALAAAYLVFTLSGRLRWAAPVAILVIVGLLGAAAFARNRIWSDPVSLWTDVVEKNPLNARAYSNLGVALYRQHRFQEAIAHYRKALQINPHHHKIITNYAAALISAGDPDTAIEVLGKSLGGRPEDVSMHFHMGVALWKKGRFAEAETHLEKTIAKRPDDPKVNYHYGYVLTNLGQLERAAEHFSRVLQKDPGHSDARYSLGAIAFKQGRLEDASRQFGELVRREPGNAKAHFNLGYIAARRDRSDDAVHHYTETLRLEPGNADAHVNLGNVMSRAGRHKEAAAQYAAALKIRPDDARAKAGLSREQAKGADSRAGAVNRTP